MSKELIIVESPTKERTIGKILGGNYVIRSSYGHLRDLPEKELGVDVKNGFEPRYEMLPRAKKVVPDLTRLAKKAKSIYLATDFDREGEAIAWHLTKILDLDEKKAKRITFHEITPEAIRESFKTARGIHLPLVDAQLARRILDRLVGYKLSPLLWRKVRRGLSAGRVQSVAVRLICAREEEILKFVAEEFWTLEADLEKSGQSFRAQLHSCGETRYDKFAFRNREKLDEVLRKLDGASYTVQRVEPKEKRRQPTPPFTTASLQQEASRRLYFSTSQTMMIAQQLYEGVEAGTEGPVGLITYMRTDSVSVAKEAQQEAVQWVEAKYGKSYLPAKPRIYKTKAKGAQEAHECIRPTKVSRTPDSLRDILNNEQMKLYELIWSRFIASQMAEAVYDTVTVDIAASDYLFRAAGRTLKFNGFLVIYEETDDSPKENEPAVLPVLTAGDLLALKELKPEQHFTEPPPRFNEASLVKVLEEHGIGRPSTYAPIIKTILDRGYVRLEERRFFPTELGKVVDRQLQQHFKEIVDVGFTAKIEEHLDDIASGKAKWRETVMDFYKPFLASLEKAETEMETVRLKPVETDEKCMLCGAPMFLRENRFGKYLACSAYPKCRHTVPLDKTGQKIVPQNTDEKCGKCGKPMVMKSRRNSRFLACTGYPDCRNTISIDRSGNKIIRPAPEMTDEKCEKCGKPMLKRFGKRGPFLACSGFPRCRNIRKVST
ncbi:MAG TPA: type I DNA topoisomerase [Elusimicrobiota bacterium]|nr:type I DNA topoisomerase [Elusimicrobiota bacterium]